MLSVISYPRYIGRKQYLALENQQGYSCYFLQLSFYFLN